jgi:hypothetical protein
VLWQESITGQFETSEMQQRPASVSVECHRLLLLIRLSGGRRYPCARKGSLDPRVFSTLGSGSTHSGTDVKLKSTLLLLP